MCGSCLPHCPTFNRLGTESHSPRGRIALARALEQKPALADDRSVREALESCLQCRACESICPAHVQYGAIIEGARAQLAKARAPSVESRALIFASEHAALSAHALGVAGGLVRALRVPGKRARLLAMAQTPIPLSASSDASALLFVGCVSRSFESSAQSDLLAVARSLKLDLVAAKQQACCGAIQRHLGDSHGAQMAANANRERFASMHTRTIVSMDSGCIQALRQSMEAPTEVVEACQWLLRFEAQWTQALPESQPPQRIGIFTPCTHRGLGNESGAVSALLGRISKLEVIPITAGFGCCGSAGPHLLAHPDAANAYAAPIIDQIRSLKLDAVVTTNVGCAVHLRERIAAAGLHRHRPPHTELPIKHPVAFLTAALGLKRS